MVLRELISMFGVSDPLRDMGENFNRMLVLTHSLNLTVSQIYFNEIDGNGEPERATLLWPRRKSKCAWTVHSSVNHHTSVSSRKWSWRALLFASYDTCERRGASWRLRKESCTTGRNSTWNISTRARTWWVVIDSTRCRAYFSSALNVFQEVSHDEALKLIRDGRMISRKCDRFLYQIGTSSNDAGTMTALILGTRFYNKDMWASA